MIEVTPRNLLLTFVVFMAMACLVGYIFGFVLL